MADGCRDDGSLAPILALARLFSQRSVLQPAQDQ